MTASESLWKHKTRALLLPTPLADVDSEGEPNRELVVLEWLGWGRDSAGRNDALHRAAIADAEGVHVPDSIHLLRSPGPSTLSDPDPEVARRALVHPLSGTRPQGAVDATMRLSELRARYDEWVRHWVDDDKTPPKDSRTFAELWHGIHASATEPRHQLWLGQAPGHAVLRDHTWLAQRTMASALVGARLAGHDPCLLHVHCGPVQSFIAAARRTNDLWLGSYLVSLLSYQATKAIAKRCGPDSVIYPHLASLPLAQRDRLNPADFVKSSSVTKQAWLRASQPNRFVAVVDSSQAHAIADQAAQAVLARWKQMAADVRSGLEQTIGQAAVNRAFEGFDQQIAEHLEIDIVVQPWPSNVQHLRSMLDAAERGEAWGPPTEGERMGQYYQHVFGLGRDTLAAQRRVLSLRHERGDERTKCTQCGRREAMGPLFVEKRAQWNAWWEELRTKLRGAREDEAEAHETSEIDDDTARPKPETVEFRRGEALCAVCLTKRLACRFDLAGRNSELGLRWDDTEDHRVLLRFPSVASIASAPLRLYLLEQAAHRDMLQWLGALRRVHRAIGFTPPGNLLPGLGEIGRGKAVLNPDGTWLYTRSYDPDTVLSDHDLQEEVPKLEGLLEEAKEAFGKLGPMLAGAAGKPKGTTLRATPYYAVVLLDVDEMGKWLDGTKQGRPKLYEILDAAGIPKDEVLAKLPPSQKRPISSSLHAEVSRRQGELATETLRTIVERGHLGRVVYSGGDDVLAFVPLHTLWHCLRDVEQAFKADAALGTGVGLSAGVAIYDWRSPLSLALRAARDAEDKAKETKNCVVIDLEIRSGAPIELRLPWRLLAEDGTTKSIGDIGDISDIVTELVLDGEVGRTEADAESELLRPSAVEFLRRELDTLRHEGLEDAFKQRVRKLVKSSVRAWPWIDCMMEVEPEPRSKPRPHHVRILERQRKRGPKSQQMGQVVDFLLLLRFLVREHGGMKHGEIYEKIRQHRTRIGGKQP